MRISILLLFLIGINFTSEAQDSSAVYRPNLYVQFGFTFPITADQHLVGNASFAIENKQKLVLAFRYYGQEYLADVPPNDHVAEQFIPNHVVNEYNLSLGKVWKHNEQIFFSLSAGPSLIHYEMPYNLKKVPHPSNSWGGFFNFSIYEYEVRKYLLLGGSIRGDVAYIPWKNIGFTVGGVFNYNRKVPNGGLSLNMVVGRFQQ
jgi:hypothetical protein